MDVDGQFLPAEQKDGQRRVSGAIWLIAGKFATVGVILCEETPRGEKASIHVGQKKRCSFTPL